MRFSNSKQNLHRHGQAAFRRAGAPAALAMAAAVLLAGCASAPKEQFYALTASPVTPMATLPAEAAGGAGSEATSAQPPMTRMLVTPPNYYVEVTAVNVPPQVNRNQLVITGDRGRIELLEQQRWASPLSAEIGRVLSQGITGELGVIDVFRSPHPEKAVVYRVSTNVQRFESVPGRRAVFDAVWSVRQIGAANLLATCRSVVEEKVGDGYDALVAGHSRAIAQVSASVSAAIRAMAVGAPPTCPQ